MRDIRLHKWIIASGVALAILCMIMALLVFDFTMAIALLVIALVLPPLGLLTMPGEKPRPVWQASLITLFVLGLPLASFLQDSQTRARSLTFLIGLTEQPSISWAWLEQVYKSMPTETARHPIILPEGTTATAGQNLDLLIMLEEPEKR